MSKIPSGIEMPNRKNKGPIARNLMLPGNGTPWEDRGATGFIPAYFKTVIKSFTSPGLLMDHIRRPETTSDAASFARLSMAAWFIGTLVYSAFWHYVIYPKYTDWHFAGWVLDDEMHYWLTAVLQSAAIVGGIFLWLIVAPKIYTTLAGAELKGVTPSLIYNCFAYSLGPSLLAIVPIWGPPSARWLPFLVTALWIHFNLIVAGKMRLFIKPVSAIINVMLIGVGTLVIAGLLWGLLPFAWYDAAHAGGLEPPKPQVEAPTVTSH